MKPLLIGVDPGSTSAVAMMDFRGELISVQSGKNFPPREIISEIVETGKPVIVACDKAKIPSKVEKIANSMGAEKFTPEEDLGKERKRELGRGDNDHEKDAVASVKHAYKQLRPKIEKINELNEERPEEKAVVASKYFADELHEKQDSKDTVNNSDQEKGQKIGETAQSEQKSEGRNLEKWRRKAEKLESKVENLEEQVEDLQERLEFREQQRRNIQSKYDKLKSGKKDEMLKERELSKKKSIIQDKNNRIKELEQKLERTRIRETQYEKALNLIDDGGQILPIIDEETSKIPENAVTRSEDFQKKLIESGEKVFHIDEVEGVELLERIIVEDIPEQNFQEILEKYRDAR